ncbi:transcriptional regulator [Halobacillus mangrovi]|uniref:Transcriptional regulator n=1 Tax=Halobacillus mangrovi TaxID=402384 RepID=A0A1W6A0P2_9BACI|nr:transcriptional regulator [Halobacillus mangrovi]
MNKEIVTLPAYRAIGLKWDGPYEEVPELKKIIDRMSQKIDEVDAIEPDIQLGLSYHLRPDGFVHYSSYEVDEDHPIPEGMVDIKIPELTYLKVHHRKNQNIGETYDKIYQWIMECDYKPYEEAGKTYYDPLPIKHERYPEEREFDNPHFDILIPIIKKDQQS